VPTVSLYKRASCGVEGTTPCDREGDPSCGAGNDRCGFLGIKLEGAHPSQLPAVCGVANDFIYNRNVTIYTNRDYPTNWQFDGGKIQVICSGGTGRAAWSIRATMDWP